MFGGRGVGLEPTRVDVPVILSQSSVQYIDFCSCMFFVSKFCYFNVQIVTILKRRSANSFERLRTEAPNSDVVLADRSNVINAATKIQLFIQIN